MVNSWLENLDNTDVLTSKIEGMCITHVARGINDASLYRVSFYLQISYLTTGVIKQNNK